MKKTLLTLFTTIAVCGMSYSQVYAQIDVSVFENKADYDVDMDDFDDTGEISFVGGDNMPSGTVIGNPDGDSGYISHAKMIRTVCLCHLYHAVLNFTHIGIPNLDHLILRQ